MFKHILLPTDGSEASVRAVEKGAELAKILGAEVTLMSAVERFSGGAVGLAHGDVGHPLHEAAREAALFCLSEARALLVKYDLKVNQLVLHDGSVHQCILEAVERSGADLIVMGSHGAGALERLLVGSQTQRVLAHTRTPVLVLR